MESVACRGENHPDSLNRSGYPCLDDAGWYDENTIYAIKLFQKDHGLMQNGIVTPRTFEKLFNPNPKDDYRIRSSSKSISALNPIVQNKARKFLNACGNNGLNVVITCTFRSWDEQDMLYLQGRQTNGNVVTNARGGDSYHNWGLAFDCLLYKNGREIFNGPDFQLMVDLAKNQGFEWGGDFKSIVDMPHFQYTFGLITEDLLMGKRPPS